MCMRNRSGFATTAFLPHQVFRVCFTAVENLVAMRMRFVLHSKLRL